MDGKAAPFNFFTRLWQFFTSVKLTVVLLLSLAVTSIVGTVIPQNESPAAYFREYGEFLYRIFNVLNIFDMYHSWWFQFLLLMLTINVVVCSINRLSAVWKIVFVKTPSFDVSKFRNLAEKQELVINRATEDLKKIDDLLIPKGFGYRRVEKTDKGFCIFAEKGRWTRLGVYTVHLSVVFLLLGGLIGSLFGFEGFVTIPEGEVVNHIRLRNTGKLHQLDFEIRCDDFNVSFYDSHGRMPKEYRSSLTILEQGKPVSKKDIIVNDPLRFKGINIFQSSYGKLPPKERPLVKNPSGEIILNFRSMETGMQYPIKTAIGKSFDIPEGMGTFMIKKYTDSAAFRGQPIGKAFIGILTPKDGNPVEVLLPLQYPHFDRMRRGDYVISVVISKDDQMISDENQNLRYYTGLQVTKDPGVWIVYSGFVVMIIGCFITFFMSHQRFCIEVVKSGKKSKVMVAGTSNKNKLGMQSRVKRLSRRLLRLDRKP